MRCDVMASTWGVVYPFWRANLDFKDQPDRVELDLDEGMWFSDDAFGWEEDKVLALRLDGVLAGCVRIEEKTYLKTWRIAALGKMAIDKPRRRNGLGRCLMQAACLYMEHNNFDLSVLWASVLAFYREYGYVEVHENLMVKWLRPLAVPVQTLVEIPKHLGTW